MLAGRARTTLLASSLLTTACTSPAHITDGHWLGDIRHTTGVERIEATIDSGGRSAKLSVASWGLSEALAASAPAGPDSLAFTTVIGSDTVRFRGALSESAWIGQAKRGADSTTFELRRVHPLSDAEWRALVGTYRSESGALIGIAPFSEFGATPLVTDYTSGRIGPLIPIARNQFLVGKSLIAPLFPADTLELTDSSLRFTQRDLPAVVARRLTTRDADVQFANGAVTLSGTLTLPDGPPPHPALVLVHGSNALTRDVFGPWTRYFAGLGYAVLSYDKRGTGQSTGDWKQADFHALAGDALAGVRFLGSRADIRRDRIGLWGASQAGWIMPLVASQAPNDIAFLVVHAGSGTTVREEGVLYIEHELRFAGLPEESVAIGTRYQQLDDAVTHGESKWESLQRYYDVNSVEHSWLWPPRPADDWFRAYYRMLMDFDPAPFWKRVSCPVLLFYGELDANVPPRESWPPIERALREGGNTNVRQILLTKANHMFLGAHTGTRDEYPALSRFVPGYFDQMAQWLQAHAR